MLERNRSPHKSQLRLKIPSLMLLTGILVKANLGFVNPFNHLYHATASISVCDYYDCLLWPCYTEMSCTGICEWESSALFCAPALLIFGPLVAIDNSTPPCSPSSPKYLYVLANMCRWICILCEYLKSQVECSKIMLTCMADSKIEITSLEYAINSFAYLSCLWVCFSLE